MYKAELAQSALSQVGRWCYVWGGNGEDMSAMTDTERETWITKRESDPDNRERVRTLYSKLSEQCIFPIRGGDCSGFVYWNMRELGLWRSDRKADSMYKAAIPTSSPEPGDLAFRVDSTGKATHVGVCVGNGEFVHCKDRDVGVVKEKSSSKYWQAFGVIKEFTPAPVPPKPDPPCPPEPSKQVVRFLGSVRLRKEPTTYGKQVATAHKGDRLPLLSRGYMDSRGSEWYAVDFNGQTVYCSAYTLAKKKYTVIEEIQTDEQ